MGYQPLDPDCYPDMDKIFDKLHVLDLLNLKLLMFEAILRLLITPSTCHIIKNPKLYALVTPLFKENSYKNLFVHFMYYAMFILNHEYTVMFSQIKSNHRVIFTHQEALVMPIINCHIEINPYVQQLTGAVTLIQSVPYYLRTARRINSVKIFERRFYLATGGALTNIPLHKYNAAVSGSILIPCLSYNGIEDDFVSIRFNTARTITARNTDLYRPVGDDKLTEKEKDFMSYLEYLYPSYHSLTNQDYVSQVTRKENASKIPVDETGDKKIKPRYNVISDIDISITSDNYDTFEEIAKIIGEQIRLNCEHIGDVWIQ